MKVFGEPSNIAIQYLLKSNPYKEIGVLGESWGSFKLWLNDQEVCGFSRGGQSLSYTANLIYIVEWFSENLEYILSDDLLDLPVKGDNALELYNNSLELKTDDELEQDRWFEIRQDWFSRHNWFSNRGGSFLAEIFFRKVQDNIEIVWDTSKTVQEEGIRFDTPQGVCYVSLATFQSVVFDFLWDIVKELLVKIPENQELISVKNKLSIVMRKFRT
jgi:hypothetical protein